MDGARGKLLLQLLLFLLLSHIMVTVKKIRRDWDTLVVMTSRKLR